jgi:ferredoxin-NADP reductase
VAEPTQRATIVHVRQLSSLVRQLTLSPLEHTVSFKPGQWISVRLPIGPRPPLVRAYSMAEPESPSGQLVFAFDRVPQGLGSAYLFNVKEGDQLLFSGPYGKFVLPETITQELVFLARFTGIVPIRCMLKHLLSTSCTAPLTLSYSAASRSEMIYHDEFVELSSRHRNFRYLVTISDSHESQTPVEEWAELKSLVTHLSGRNDFIPMICGIKAFVRPVRNYFLEAGFERRSIRVEMYD